MILIDLGRLLLSLAVIITIFSLLVLSSRDGRKDENYIRQLNDLIVTKWLKFKYLYWRGYYLSVKDNPRTTEEINLSSYWSLCHGALIGLILVVILSWLSGD